MKTCSKCKTEKSFEFFYKDKTQKDGYEHRCKDCKKLYDAQRCADKKIERNKHSRKYRKEHPEVVTENWATYYQNNKERLKEEAKTRYRKHPVRYLLYAAKQRSEKLGIPFGLEEKDLTIPDICPILAIPLVIGGRIGNSRSNSPSIDRIRPELGYVKGNVAVMSLRANQIKGTATLEELKSLARFLEEFQPQSLTKQ